MELGLERSIKHEDSALRTVSGNRPISDKPHHPTTAAKMQRDRGMFGAVHVVIYWLMMFSLQGAERHFVGAFTASTLPKSTTSYFATSQSRRRINNWRMASAGTDGEPERTAKMGKATKAMTAFTNKYLKVSKTRLCTDKSVAAVVIKGLAEHKVSLGSPLCPCRFYEDKQAEAKDGYWNCPCVPMRERQECHCMLFLTDDSPFVGEEANIELDEVLELSGLVEEGDDDA